VKRAADSTAVAPFVGCGALSRGFGHRLYPFARFAGLET
jgi:hypothetical protein